MIWITDWLVHDLFELVDTIFFDNLQVFDVSADVDATLEWLHNYRWWWNNRDREHNWAIIVKVIVEFNDALHFIFEIDLVHEWRFELIQSMVEVRQQSDA